MSKPTIEDLQRAVTILALAAMIILTACGNAVDAPKACKHGARALASRVDVCELACVKSCEIDCMGACAPDDPYDPQKVDDCTVHQCLNPWDLVHQFAADASVCGGFTSIDDEEKFYEACIPAIATIKCSALRDGSAGLPEPCLNQFE
jgi:hypothetical protein